MFRFYYIITYPITFICLVLLALYRCAIRYIIRRGNCCRFLPTCSKYAWDSFVEFGWLFGGILTFKRLIKCRPDKEAGFDYPKLNILGNYKWKC